MQEAFKFYKSKQNEGKFDDLVDCELNFNHVHQVPSSQLNLNTKIEEFGLRPAVDWKVYRTDSNVYLIKNPFKPIAQRYWIVKCLKDYTKYPNRNNLLEHQFDKETIQNFWEIYTNSNLDDMVKKKLKKAFRWTTLGYHYDWTNKIYNESLKNEFPGDLAELMKRIASVLNFENYRAEAAIVNFYPIGTTLSNHTDHSELDLQSALISMSLGQDAIFLAGGLEREDKNVVAFKLSSGDLMIMSKESRLIYHAVPKVFKTSKETWNEECEGKLEEFSKLMDPTVLENCKNQNFWKSFNDYVDDVRINVNVRQVLPEGKHSL